MSLRLSLLGMLFVLAPLTLLLGCNDSGGTDPKLLAEKQEAFLLADEPDGTIQQVGELRETLLGVGEEESHDHEHAHDDEDHDHEHAHDDEDHDHEHAHDDEDHDHEHAHDDEDHDHEHAHDDEDHDHEHAHDDEDHDHEHAHEEEAAEVSLPTEVIEVVVMGQVGGITNPWAEMQPEYPFTKNEAKFFLADAGEVAEAEESGHAHAPGEECAFCAAHAKDNVEVLAVVQFVDENGKILPMDVRELFDLKEKDTVVVQGKAQVIEGGILVVEATGLYVRR